MKRRGRKPEEVAACRITDAELPTARDRVQGATDMLLENGFLQANIPDAPQRTTGTGAAFAEFSKPQETGFYGTVGVSSFLHGRQSTTNLVNWLRTGTKGWSWR